MPQNLPNYDATFCGKLPLHQTNLIQPHGFLFVLDADSFDILQISDNVQELLSKEPAVLVGTAFKKVVDENSFVQLQQVTRQATGAKQPIRLNLASGDAFIPCSGLVHEKGGLLLVEVLNPLLADGKGRSFLDAYQDIRTLMHETTRSGNLTAFAVAVARVMRRLSGFDKVMVYSFDADWNGTVIAEEKAEAMVSYLGLRFPASDIPKPARDLYLKNPYRFIPNSGYKPVKLFPLLNPNTHTLTDLSGCDLRSVAAVHLEYLKNMEVTASLSLRLVHNGRLWGLVSCHHRTPLYLSFETLGFFELLSDIISAELSIVVNNYVAGKQQALQGRLTQLVSKLHNEDSLQTALEKNAPEVQQLLGAGGLAYNLNGHVQYSGQAPEENDLHRLFYWLQVQSPQELVHLPSLPHIFEEAASFAAVGSGMLALPVVPDKGNFVVAFRPEAIEEVSWGGNPHEALQFEADGKTYHPRHSFNVWKQTVRNTAKPWSVEELTVAEAFRNVLTGIALRRSNT